MIASHATTWLTWLAGGIAVLTLAGCASHGAIDYRNAATGERWRVSNPPEAQAPATLVRGIDGDISATVSPPFQPDTAIEQLAAIPLIGVGLIVTGVGALVLRAWFPIVPITASLAAMATGAALFAVPKLVQEAWWLIGLVLLGLAVMYAISFFDNRSLLKIPNPKEASP